MWKRVDNSLYRYLRKKMYDDYYPDLWAGAVIIALISIVFIPFLTAFKTHSILFYLDVGGFALAVILFLVGIYFVKKNREVINKLDCENNAQGCKATLVKKKNSADYRPKDNKACFHVIVEVEGRRLDVHCCKDVYIGCVTGDEVYLVDLLGEGAARPKTCLAVKSLEAPKQRYSPETMGEEKYSILYEKTKGGIADIIDESLSVPDGAEFARVIKHDQCEAIRKKERKPIILAVIGFLVLVGIDIFTFKPNLSGIAILWPLFLILSFLYFFFLCSVCITHGERLHALKRYRATTLEVMILDKAFVQYSANKRNVSVYYYRCRTADGKDIYLESTRRTRLPTGQKVLAVFYFKKAIKFYPISLYCAD